MGHQRVKNLSNASAVWIELGKYEKAIESLGTAFKFSKWHTTDQLLDRSKVCTCFDCSLDCCIAHSENDSNIVESIDISLSNNKIKKKSNRKRNAMDIDEPPILHRRPIRIPKRSIREGHKMGSTLFLIITFNLALAHHLKALKKTDSSSSAARNSLNSTIQLYELAYELANELANNWQHPHGSNYVTDDEDSSEDYSIISMEADDSYNNSSYSTRFNTILYTNLSHLNQMIRNNKDSRSSSLKRRLNELISTVPPHSLFTNDDDDESNDHLNTEKQRYHHPHQPTSTTANNHNEY